MTFIALGVFDKVKNISITDVTKKLKDYVMQYTIQPVKDFFILEKSGWTYC